MEEASEEEAASWVEEEASGVAVAPYLACPAAPRGLHCMVRSWEGGEVKSLLLFLSFCSITRSNYGILQMYGNNLDQINQNKPTDTLDRVSISLTHKGVIM